MSIFINAGLLLAQNTTNSLAASKLKDKDACFILLNLKTNKIIERFGGDRCAERTPPCSTFKVPLAIMGFDNGILNDVTTTFKWDGKAKMLKTWEKDQDARSWMKESVVWYSQKIAVHLGRKYITKYMKDFAYGNADMSGGLETAWLSPSPKSDNKSSISISADEQVKFFAKLWRDELTVSKKAMELTREITYLEASKNGFTLHGKTGSGYAAKNTKRRLGWFVARIAKANEEYIGVLTFSDIKDPKSTSGYAGPESKVLFKDIITDMGYW